MEAAAQPLPDGEIYEVSGSVIDKTMMIVRLAGLTEKLPGVGVVKGRR